MRIGWLAGTLCLLVSVGVLGCGPKGVPGTTGVGGTVKFKNQPVEGAMVTFSPTTEGLRAATATTDAQGRFALMTLRPGDGAMPGKYAVTIWKSEGGSAQAPGTIAAPTEADLNNPAAMKAAWEKAKAEQKSSKAGPKDVLPSKYKTPKESGLTAEVKAGEKNDFTFDLTE